MIFNIDSGLPKLYYDFSFDNLVQGVDWDWYNNENDINGNWAIQFWKVGSYNIQLLTNKAVDIHCVGGGGRGAQVTHTRGTGGGAGYAKCAKNVILTDSIITVTVGAGSDGTTSSADRSSKFGTYCIAAGGENAGNGGSGGGAGGYTGIQGEGNGASGGSNGSNGSSNPRGSTPGKGQINQPGPNGETGNTYDFQDTTLVLRCGGGGGSGGSNDAWWTTSPGAGGAGGGGGGGNPYAAAGNGKDRYGGGGGSGYGGGYGGSGIVIIRNHR